MEGSSQGGANSFVTELVSAESERGGVSVGVATALSLFAIPETRRGADENATEPTMSEQERKLQLVARE